MLKHNAKIMNKLCKKIINTLTAYITYITIDNKTCTCVSFFRCSGMLPPK